VAIRFLLFAAALFFLNPAGLVAQFLDLDHLAAGQFVVATDKLGDPNFSQAVVLLIHYDASEGAVGIIVNRKTELTLAKIFPEKKAAADPVFEGGPVEIQVVQALIRSAAKPTGATALVGDVYETGSKTEIDKAINSHATPSHFRAFLGYAGWGGGQLEDEIKSGAWSIVRATPKTIFDEDPDSLWDRLNRQANSQIAGLNLNRSLGVRGLSLATLRQ
jgi:putative transcriptional regulator